MPFLNRILICHFLTNNYAVLKMNNVSWLFSFYFSFNVQYLFNKEPSSSEIDHLPHCLDMCNPPKNRW